jgi:hypothetical protein
MMRRCQRGAHRSTTTTERWHDNDEEWQWLELSVRVEEGERERERELRSEGEKCGVGRGWTSPIYRGLGSTGEAAMGG